ncbi:MAG: HEAT repeat domain-containing protein [Pirellulales bacterium]
MPALALLSLCFAFAAPATTDDIPALIAALRAEPHVLETKLGNCRGYESPGADAYLKLYKLGEPAIEPLAALLNDDSKTVRLNAIATLGAIGGTKALAALMPVLDDKDPRIRAATVARLNLLAEQNVLDAVLARLRDDDALVRAAAVQRLTIQDKTFKNHPSNVQINQIITALAEIANAPEASLRGTAVTTLGSYRTPNALPTLRKLVDDPDTDVRGAVAAAFGRTRSRQALDPLLTMLQNERDADDRTIDVVRNAIGSLAELGDPRGVETIIALLDHRDLQTRVAAVRARDDSRPSRGRAAVTADRDRRSATAACGRCVDRFAGRSRGRTVDRGLADRRRTRPRGRDRSARTPERRPGDRTFGRRTVSDRREVDVADRRGRAALERIRDPRVVRAAAERSVAAPTTDGGFRARRLVGKLVDREFRFDADGFAAWWKEESARK